MKTRRIAAGAVLLALNLGLNACGGDDSRSGGSELSRNELAVKANAICAVAISKGPVNQVPAGFMDNAASLAAMFDRALPVIDQQTEALRALRPAAEATTDWRAFVTAEIAADHLLHRQRAALNRSPVPGDDTDKGRLLKNLVATATKIGATTCVSG